MERGNAAPAKFVPRRLAEKLRAETPTAVGGEQIFEYRGGAYGHLMPGSRDEVRERMDAYLADASERARVS